MTAVETLPWFSESEVQELRASFLAMVPLSDRVADRLYSIVFARHPELRTMFPTEMSGQKDVLIHALASMLDRVGSPAEFLALGAEMGRRHVAYGTRPEQYEVVGEALIEALRAEAALDERQESLWRRLYSLVADSMLRV